MIKFSFVFACILIVFFIGNAWVWTTLQIIESDFHQIDLTLVMRCVVAAIVPTAAAIFIICSIDD